MKPAFILHRIDPQVFTLEVVVDTAYCLINRLDFRIEGDPNKEILVKVRSRSEKVSQDQVSSLFDEKLIESFIAACRWHANSALRLYFINSALSFTPNQVDIRELKERTESMALVDYQISQDRNRDSVVSFINLQGHKQDALLERLFIAIKPLIPIAHLTEFRIKDTKLIFKAKPKDNLQIDELEVKLHQRLEDLLHNSRRS